MNDDHLLSLRRHLESGEATESVPGGVRFFSGGTTVFASDAEVRDQSRRILHDRRVDRWIRRMVLRGL